MPDTEDGGGCKAPGGRPASRPLTLAADAAAAIAARSLAPQRSGAGAAPAAVAAGEGTARPPTVAAGPATCGGEPPAAADDPGAPPTIDIKAPAALGPLLPPGTDPDARLVRGRDDPRPAGAGGDVRRGRSRAAEYRRAARADNTRRAYRAAVTSFTGWCHEHGQVALPASPETVAAFLVAKAGRGLALNTLRLRHAALRYLHLLAGTPPPTASPVVPAIFAGIRRARRRSLRKETALVLDPLRAAVKEIPASLPGLRDRALLLVGFAAALRPSELAALTLEHLNRHEDGIALFLPWRKNDQEGRGTPVWLPCGHTDLCPVRALEAWLAGAEITEGPLFRRIWRLPPPRWRRGLWPQPAPARYRVGSAAINTDGVALVVKRCTGRPGSTATSSPATAGAAAPSRAGSRSGSTSQGSSSFRGTPP